MSDRSARAWVLGVVGLCGALFAACGDDSAAGAGGSGANGAGSPGGGGATGGSAQGAGGEGGDPFSCAECVFPQNICIDDASCGQACPSERELAVPTPYELAQPETARVRAASAPAIALRVAE